MSILFVLLTFLLIISSMYLRKPQPAESTMQVANGHKLPVPVMTTTDGFEVPTAYSFHPGHTWLNDEGHQNGRVGMDAFAANLVGHMDAVDFVELNRWVRQGQRLCTITQAGRKVELLSPVEGVLISINQEVRQNPTLAIDDPYSEGWLCVIKAPELSINAKNLLHGPLVSAWMQNSFVRLREMLQASAMPALAQDGGLPVKGVLFQVSPNVQQKLTREFFLT